MIIITNKNTEMESVDPLEGPSLPLEIVMKTEVKDENEDNNFEQCFPNSIEFDDDSDPIEFNSTDVMKNPKTGALVCMHCLQQLTPETLLPHMVSMHKYRRINYKCYICGTVFKEKNIHAVHYSRCRPQSKKTKRRKTYTQIMKELDESNPCDNDEEATVCPICMLELPKHFLKEHLVTEHSDPTVSVDCGICHKTFKSKLTLREHIKLVHDTVQKTAECEHCGMKFKSRKYLANHKRNVHPKGNKIHKCDICEKEFKSHLSLYQHRKHVHVCARVNCPHCSRAFRSQHTLIQHIAFIHPDQAKDDSYEGDATLGDDGDGYAFDDLM